jgi:lipoprotein-releasing system permease protein
VFERFIACRYLRSSRQEGFVSVIAIFSLLGISLGVATLIIVLSVMNGFRSDLLNRIIGINGHLWVLSNSSELKANNDVLENIKSLPGVTLAQPTIERQAVLMLKGQARGVQVHGMNQEDLKKRKVISDHVISGSIDDFSEQKIFIGKRLAELYQVQVGDKVNLMSPDGNQTAFGNVPKQKTFEVGGIFEIGMSEYDKSVIFMPLESAQTFFKMTDQWSNIEVFIENMDYAMKFASIIQGKIGNDYRLIDWQHSNSNFFQAVQTERNVMFIILTIIILVAAFNIISGLIMLVKDKTRDIAILRTMGASRGSILKIFFITGASIGIIGTLLGVVGGIAFTLNIDAIRHFLEVFSGSDLFNAEIYFLTKVPAKIDPSEVTMVILMGLGLSFLATLFPAWRAARLNPVEALRQ